MKDILNNKGEAINGEIIQGSFGSLLAMLKAGHADIALELEPVTSIAVANGAKVVYSMVDSYGDFAFTGLTATDSFLATNPEIAQSAVNAINSAINYIHSDFNGALAVAMKEFPKVDKDILNNALTRLISEGVIPRSPVLSEEAWNKAIKLRQDVGDIKGMGVYADHVDMHYAQKAASK